MKKLLVVFLFTLTVASYSAANIARAATLHPSLQNGSATLQNDSAILQNVIARFLTEDIAKAVEEYYSEYLLNPPQIETYAGKSATKVLDIRYDADKNLYIIRVETKPYVGAHNSIGQDIIIFEIDGIGQAKVSNYEHVKSYDIVPWYKDDIIKPFPKDTY